MGPDGVELTDRDRDLLRTLTHCVRTLSLAQVARFWWSKSTNPATPAARLKQLARADFVTFEPQHVEPELRLVAPLACWQPGCSCPDLSLVASTARQRWNRPATTTPHVVATPHAAAQFGGRGGRAPRPTEWTHDMHLAGVYLTMRAELPTRAASWTHEDLEERPAAARPGEKLPDAFVTDGLHRTAIELVGSSYTEAKLHAFHDYCDTAGLAYELW
jgi:hypothetical protein